MGFISTWKRNAVHNLKPFQSPFQHRMVGASERLSSCGCLDRFCSPFACFKAEKYKKSFWVVFILPNFHDTFPLGRLQCLCWHGGLGLWQSKCWASPKLLSLALGCSNDQALWAAVLPQKPRVFMWLFLQQMTVFQYLEWLFVSLDLKVTET